MAKYYSATDGHNTRTGIAGAKTYFYRPIKPVSTESAIVETDIPEVENDATATSKLTIGIAYPVQGESYSYDSGGYYAAEGQKLYIVLPGSRDRVRVRSAGAWNTATDPLCACASGGVGPAGLNTNAQVGRAVINATYAAGDYPEIILTLIPPVALT